MMKIILTPTKGCISHYLATAKRIAVLLMLLGITACASFPEKYRKSPCACDFVPIKEVQRG